MANHTVDKFTFNGETYILQDNVSGYITDAGVTSFNGSTGAVTYTAPVTSVNGNTGAVTVSVPTKTSQLTNDSGFITAADVPEGSTASTTTPLMDGTASVGTETAFARGDHRHPSDTSRVPVTVADGDSSSTILNSGYSIYGECGSGTLTTIFSANTSKARLYAQDVSYRTEAEINVKPEGYAEIYTNDGSNTASAIFTPSASTIPNANLTGTPVAPTPTSDDNSTKIATTEFVQTALSGVGGTTTWYGTLTTSGTSTAAKVVTCEGFTLTTGAIIGIYCGYANTAATPTLNINGTSAKSILIGGTAPNATTNALKWSAGTMLYVMYDGTQYRYITARSVATVNSPDGAGSWYGTSSSTATAAAKTSTITNYRLTPGARVSITFSTANTYTSGALTLNVNSTGAKNIYYNNAVTSATNTLLWDAGECLTFIYTGSYYYFVSRSKGESLTALTTEEIQTAVTSGWGSGAIANANNIAY